MKCPRCHSENPDTSRFCSNCAALLAQEGQASVFLTKTLETPLHVISKDKLIAGKYRILEEIGQGGMGIVYKAEDLKLKRCVALKFLPPHLVNSLELKERFIIEAQAAAALSHPNICVIYEVGEDGEKSFIAMEYVEGETLRDKIKKGPLKAEEALDIAGQIAAGLGEAHHKGIIHRDIKSANIMVTEQGQAKVMDFGLAKLRGGSSLTKSQTTLGTVAYMSPEQARGDELDGRTDIWSLGVVLYEMLAGKLPFHGEHDQTVIYSILHQEPESLMKASPGTAPELAQIVGQALAKKAAERYQTMEEFGEDLAAVAEGLRPLKARPAKTILGIRTAYVYSALAVVLALGFGLDIGGLRSRLLGRAPSRAVRLAVLPFENLSGDPEQEYFSDGMTGEMIAQLGRLHPESLSVIARTSVMRYKKANTPIDQVGRELNVGYVLEGSVQREGPRVRIRAELIKVQDQSQLWADSLEREMSGVLALQNEVSQKVAAALALKLLPAEQARLANARAVNPEAYEAYLKGSQYVAKLTKPDLDTAYDYFELALRKDPNYALAYTGIASVWICRNQMKYTTPAEAIPKAKAAALKAMELDDNLAEAHASLASVRTRGELNLLAAEPEWKRADELGYMDLGHYWLNMGRPDEAMAKIKKALELDPFNPMAQSFYAVILYCARRYNEAVAQARKTLAMQPGAPVAEGALYFSLRELKKYDEVHAIDRKWFSDFPALLEALDRAYAKVGYAKAWGAVADEQAALHDKGMGAIDIADSYLLVGDKNKALDWLETAYEERDPDLPYINCWPHWDSLRSEPRFQALLRRMGIPVRGNK
jgi:serine/threonine protein kinase/tetratricopeptide (TPR) repeat protein